MWERRLMKYCDENPDVLSWSSEELVIPYLSPIDRKLHRYFPDFLIKVKRGEKTQTIVIEVKPKKETKPPKKKKNITPINDKIRASEVMLIGSNGEKQGLVAFSVALESARVASLDLVQVSPSDATPVVCKLLDYGKHLFDKKKSISSSKVKVKRNTTKEIKFRPSTDVGDYNIKLKKIKSFILDGDKTKISVRFRGREILNSDIGLNLLNKQYLPVLYRTNKDFNSLSKQNLTTKFAQSAPVSS